MDSIEASALPAVTDGEFWVFPDGRRIARVHGSDDLGDAGAAVADTDAGVDVADQGASTETQGVDQPDASTPGFEAPFSLDDVPEDIRDHVARYQKQLQAAFTRKTMSLAEERKPIESMLTLQERLANPDTRQEALAEFLGQYDLELEIEGDEDEGEDRSAELEALAGTDEEDLPEWAKELLEKERQREEQATAKAQAEAQERLRQHVSTAMEAFAKKVYGPEGELPAEAHDALLGLGMVLPPQADGLPNMAAAAEMLEAIEAAAVQRFVDSKKGATLPATRIGSSGTDKPDLNNDTERLQRANAVAARHLQSGS